MIVVIVAFVVVIVTAKLLLWSVVLLLWSVVLSFFEAIIGVVIVHLTECAVFCTCIIDRVAAQARRDFNLHFIFNFVEGDSGHTSQNDFKGIEFLW